MNKPNHDKKLRKDNYEYSQVKEFIETLVEKRVSITTGTRTTKDGTEPYWSWWDSDDGCAKGETLSGLILHLSSKEPR